MNTAEAIQELDLAAEATRQGDTALANQHTRQAVAMLTARLTVPEAGQPEPPLNGTSAFSLQPSALGRTAALTRAEHNAFPKGRWT